MSDDRKSTSTDIAFATCDGVKIAATVHDRGQDGPTAVIVMMTPYNRSMWSVPTEFLDAGFRVVFADSRGTGDSGGVFEGMFSPREVSDAAELIEWLADQPFCNGKVAWSGPSYMGCLGLLVAARRPRGLVCLDCVAGPLDLLRNILRLGGIPRTSHWAAGVFLRGQPIRSVAPAMESYTSMACQELDGPVFRERSPIEVLGHIEVPVVFVGGLYDVHSVSTFLGYEIVDVPKRMFVIASGHGAFLLPEVRAEQTRWFTYWLSSEGEPPAPGGDARVKVLGTDRWLECSGPPKVTPLSRHLTSSALDIAVQPWQSAAPIAPSPTPEEDAMLGLHSWGETVVLHVGDLDGQLLFGSPVLRLVFRAEACADAYFFVRLLTIDEDDTAEQVTEGRLRLSHRAIDPDRSSFHPDGEPHHIWLTHSDPQALEQGAELEAMIELLPTCLGLRSGKQLALGFAATRPEGGSATDGRITVLTESRIVFPVLPPDVVASP